MTILYADPRFQLHDTGRHPEQPQRLQAIEERLRQAGLMERCRVGQVETLTPAQLQTVHAPLVVERAHQTSAQGGGLLDADTVVSTASYDVARAAAGTGVAAVDAVLSGRDRNALCLIRPPGHHATPTHSMGFCLFNNIALAAQHARRQHGLERILIVDWDVHHGNGTQDVFYDDPHVFFLSIHRYGHGFYPGTGAADETGSGRGLGFTANVPLRAETPRDVYVERFRSALERAADTMKPELVLVSAGFDAHRLDPLGSLGLEAEDFATLTGLLLDVARTHARGRLVSCLEGGYHLAALAASVEAHLETLLAADA